MLRLKAEAEIPLQAPASTFLIGETSYVASRDKDGLLPVTTKTNKSEAILTGLTKPCGGILNAFGALWAPSCGEAKVSRFDTKAKKVTDSVGVASVDQPQAFAATADSLWLISDLKTTLSRIDPEAKRVVAEVRLPAKCTAIVSGEGALWAACPGEDKVLRINTHTSLVENRVEVAGEPVALAVGAGSIWVLGKKDGKVFRIDPKTNKVSATIETSLPGLGRSVAFGDGFAWVSADGFPITRIDPETDKVVQQFAGAGSGVIAFGSGSVWIADSDGAMLRRYDPKRIRATLAE